MSDHEATIDRIATILVKPWGENHIPQVPWDPGFAVFQPLPGWAKDKATALYEAGMRLVPPEDFTA